MRTLEELVDAKESSWPRVEQMFADAKNRLVVLPAEGERGAQALVTIQVMTRSPMGAIAHRTGGLLVDHGWVRVLGAGHARLPRDLGGWNRDDGDGSQPRFPGAFLVADDVVGGFFALNGGAFQGPQGNVFYLAPDTLRWEDVGRGYTDFLHFVLAGDLAKFYEGHRWNGWEQEVEALAGDRAFGFYPFLWAECKGGLEARSRKNVSLRELWNLHAVELPAQLFGRR